MNAAIRYKAILVVFGVILLFPAFNLVERFFLSVNKVEVSCEVTLDRETKLHVFYDRGIGWNPANRVVAELKSEELNGYVEFPTIRTSTLKGFRLYFRTLDSLETYQTPIMLGAFTVMSAHDTICIPLDTAHVRTTCLKILSNEEENELLLDVTCEDSYVEFKQNIDSLQVAEYTTLDKFIIGGFILLYLGIFVLFWLQMPWSLRLESVTFIHAFFSICFVLFVGVHWYFYSSGFSGVDPTLEKRILASYPADTCENYTKDFEEWFEDQFSIRQVLTRFKSLMDFHLLDKSSLPHKVVMGKNKELFPSSEFILDDFMGEMELTQPQRVSIRKNIMERVNYMESLGKNYFLLLPPSKQTIYADEMPFKYRKFRNADSTMLSQLMFFLSTDSVISNYVCDPRPVILSKAKEKQRLYFKSDIHWNSYGAFYGYQEFFKLIARKVPALNPYQLSDFMVTKSIDYEADLARMLMLFKDEPRTRYVFNLKNGHKFKQEVSLGAYDFPIFYTSIPDSSLPTALVFRDSYCQDLIQFMALHFSDALYVWDQKFDIALIKERQPDIVIQEVTEMLMYDLLRINPKEIRVD